MRKVLTILGQLNDDDVDWMARCGERRDLARGAVLVTQGKAVDEICIVLDGRVSVSADGIGQLAELGAGEIVGEMSFVDSRPPSASVAAVAPTVVLALSKTQVAERLARDVGFAARFYKAVAIFLSQRMRSTVATLGYAKKGASAAPSLDDAENAAEELDLNVLDNVNKAGARFDRLLKRVM